MGKGQGCIPSKAKKKEDLAPPSPPPHPPPPAAQHEGGKEEVVTESTSASRDTPIIEAPVSASQQSSNVETPPSKKISVYIVYYSMYGHVEALAKKIKEGADSVEGVEGVLFQVPETLSPSVLEKMMAPPKDESVPIITAAQLPEADAIIFGFPTRYGAMAAQMKAFFDTTGQLWQGQKLAGKPAGLFVSTGTQGGGQETTAWTAITQLTHHGMLFVPIGYTFGSGMFTMEEIRGGSPYGSGTFAGDGSRKPSEAELALAEHQGKYTAGIVKKLLESS